MGFRIKQLPGGGVSFSDGRFDLGSSPLSSVTVEHMQFGPFVQTKLVLNNVAQAISNGVEHAGTKIYDFPQCRINIQGVTATLQQKTTSALAGTINASVVGAVSLGTVTSNSVTLSGTRADLLASTAFTSSATVNVAGTAVTGALSTSAQFDGTATAKDMYLNSAYATTTDVDGDATQTWSGTIIITWQNLGDY